MHKTVKHHLITSESKPICDRPNLQSPHGRIHGASGAGEISRHYVKTNPKADSYPQATRTPSIRAASPMLAQPCRCVRVRTETAGRPGVFALKLHDVLMRTASLALTPTSGTASLYSTPPMPGCSWSELHGVLAQSRRRQSASALAAHSYPRPLPCLSPHHFGLTCWNIQAAMAHEWERLMPFLSHHHDAGALPLPPPRC
jgi:hypothetical protein